MAVYQTNRSGCGAGCFLLLVAIILLPVMLIIQLLGGRKMSFGGMPFPKSPPRPSKAGDDVESSRDGSFSGGEVLDIEAQEVESSSDTGKESPRIGH